MAEEERGSKSESSNASVSSQNPFVQDIEKSFPPFPPIASEPFEQPSLVLSASSSSVSESAANITTPLSPPSQQDGVNISIRKDFISSPSHSASNSPPTVPVTSLRSSHSIIIPDLSSFSPRTPPPDQSPPPASSLPSLLLDMSIDTLSRLKPVDISYHDMNNSADFENDDGNDANNTHKRGPDFFNTSKAHVLLQTPPTPLRKQRAEEAIKQERRLLASEGSSSPDSMCMADVYQKAMMMDPEEEDEEDEDEEDDESEGEEPQHRSKNRFTQTELSFSPDATLEIIPSEEQQQQHSTLPSPSPHIKLLISRSSSITPSTAKHIPSHPSSSSVRFLDVEFSPFSAASPPATPLRPAASAASPSIVDFSPIHHANNLSSHTLVLRTPGLSPFPVSNAASSSRTRSRIPSSPAPSAASTSISQLPLFSPILPAATPSRSALKSALKKPPLSVPITPTPKSPQTVHIIESDISRISKSLDEEFEQQHEPPAAAEAARAPSPSIPHNFDDELESKKQKRRSSAVKQLFNYEEQSGIHGEEDEEGLTAVSSELSLARASPPSASVFSRAEPLPPSSISPTPAPASFSSSSSSSGKSKYLATLPSEESHSNHSIPVWPSPQDLRFIPQQQQQHPSFSSISISSMISPSAVAAQVALAQLRTLSIHSPPPRPTSPYFVSSLAASPQYYNGRSPSPSLSPTSAGIQRSRSPSPTYFGYQQQQQQQVQPQYYYPSSHTPYSQAYYNQPQFAPSFAPFTSPLSSSSASTHQRSFSASAVSPSALSYGPTPSSYSVPVQGGTKALSPKSYDLLKSRWMTTLQHAQEVRNR